MGIRFFSKQKFSPHKKNHFENKSITTKGYRLGGIFLPRRTRRKTRRHAKKARLKACKKNKYVKPSFSPLRLCVKKKLILFFFFLALSSALPSRFSSQRSLRFFASFAVKKSHQDGILCCKKNPPK